MSANNWRTCPRCERLLVELADVKQQAIQAAEAANDLVAFKVAQLISVPEAQETFAEYYEFYWDKDIPGKNLIASYHGICDKCDLEIKLLSAHDFTDRINANPLRDIFGPSR